MTAAELIELQHALALLLQRVGPVQFIRDLCHPVNGGQVLPKGPRKNKSMTSASGRIRVGRWTMSPW